MLNQYRNEFGTRFMTTFFECYDLFWSFRFRTFVLVSNFEIRASKLGFSFIFLCLFLQLIQDIDCIERGQLIDLELFQQSPDGIGRNE